jgi:hypothetical protein
MGKAVRGAPGIPRRERPVTTTTGDDARHGRDVHPVRRGNYTREELGEGSL